MRVGTPLVATAPAPATPPLNARSLGAAMDTIIRPTRGKSAIIWHRIQTPPVQLEHATSCANVSKSSHGAHIWVSRLIMNKLILVIAVLWLSASAEAQSRLGIALKAGPNATTWARENRDYKYGFSGGLAGNLRRRIGTQFSFGGQMELLYVARGADVVSDDETIGTFRQHYFDVAVEMRPEMRFGSVGVYVILGASWDILMKANRESYIGMGSQDDVTDSLVRHDVALVGGAGVAVYLPVQKLGPARLDTLFLEVHYDRGLIDFDPTSDGSAKNRSTSLMVGLSFALGSS